MTNISPLVCDPRSYKRMTIITPRNQGNIYNDHERGGNNSPNLAIGFCSNQSSFVRCVRRAALPNTYIPVRATGLCWLSNALRRARQQSWLELISGFC